MTIKEKALIIIGKKSKRYLYQALDITAPTLDSRLKKGGWLDKEVEIMEKLLNK